MKFIVYVLSSLVSIKSYVGYTNNLERRLKEHNAGKCAFTKKYAPWKIIYTEDFENSLEARRREKYLKSHAGREKILRNLFTSS